MATYESGKFVALSNPNKTRTRALVYLMALEEQGQDAFVSQHHLVLGGVGGDIELLLNLGVPSTLIHVAERRLGTYRKLIEAYPAGFDVYYGDVLEMCPKLWDYKFSTVNLDFCGKLRTPLVDLVAGVVKLTNPGMLFVTLCAAREQELGIREELVAKDLELAQLGYNHTTGHIRGAVLAEMLKLRLPAITTGASISYLSSSSERYSSMSTSTYYVRDINMGNRSLVFGDLLKDKELAFRFRAVGYKSQHIAPILGHPRQRVAKWFADATRQARQ